MDLVAIILVAVFAAFIIVAMVTVTVVDMFGRIDFLDSHAPWLRTFLETRKATNVLLLVAIFMLLGTGYELQTKEVPEVPKPPIVSIHPPVPPPLTIIETARPIKQQCWIKNYATPAISATPLWGMATVLCNMTIKPPYSVEFDYDQTVGLLSPIVIPVGGEFAKYSLNHPEGNKAVAMFDLHTIIPNEPFSITVQGSDGKIPLVTAAIIRAKGVVLEFHP